MFFVSPQAAHKCRDALHKRQMGDRYIEVLACADRRGRRKADDLLKEPALAAATRHAIYFCFLFGGGGLRGGVRGV